MRTPFRILTSLTVALLGLTITAPRAQALPPLPVPLTTATDAVLFMSGTIDAEADIEASLAVPIEQRISFREMARNNRMLANLVLLNAGSVAAPVALYLFGRAARFDEAADAAGEPA